MDSSHSLMMGYALWLLGFTGSHRFYYGKQVTGTIWLFTLGLLGLGWIFDFFYMPWLCASAERRYAAGGTSYNIAWLLLTFFGVLGLHRFYLGKWVTGILYLVTGGFLLVGVVYDFLTLNGQIAELNKQKR